MRTGVSVLLALWLAAWPAMAQQTQEATCEDKLGGRDRALDRLNQQVAQLAEMLSLEQAEKSELKNSLSRLTLHLGTLTAERDRLSSQLAVLLPERDMLTNRVAAPTSERDALKVASTRSAAELEDEVSCHAEFITFPTARRDGSSGLITVRKVEIEGIKPSDKKGFASTVVLNTGRSPVWIWPKSHQAIVKCLDRWTISVPSLFK